MPNFQTPSSQSSPAPRRRTGSPQGTARSGWDQVVERQRQSEARKNANQNKPGYLKLANKFYLRDGDDVMIQFLNDDPVCVDGCNIPPDFDFYVSRKEVDRSCPMVDAGLKLQMKAAFKVLDYRGDYDKVKKDFKYDQPVERYWLVNVTMAAQLNGIQNRKGKPLSAMVFYASRSGSSKNDTVYNFEQAIDDQDRLISPITDWVEQLPSLEEVLTPMAWDDLQTILDGGVVDAPQATAPAPRRSAPAAQQPPQYAQRQQRPAPPPAPRSPRGMPPQRQAPAAGRYAPRGGQQYGNDNAAY